MRSRTESDLDLLRVIEALEALVADPALVASLSKDEHVRLMAAAGRLSRPSKIERLQISRKIRKEKHRRVIRADRDLPRQVDGEVIAPGRELTVTVRPGALLVRVPGPAPVRVAGPALAGVPGPA